MASRSCLLLFCSRPFSTSSPCWQLSCSWSVPVPTSELWPPVCWTRTKPGTIQMLLKIFNTKHLPREYTDAHCGVKLQSNVLKSAFQDKGEPIKPYFFIIQLSVCKPCFWLHDYLYVLFVCFLFFVLLWLLTTLFILHQFTWIETHRITLYTCSWRVWKKQDVIGVCTVSTESLESVVDLFSTRGVGTRSLRCLVFSEWFVSINSANLIHLHQFTDALKRANLFSRQFSTVNGTTLVMRYV